MTTRNLDARFAARAIAINGISVKPGSVGEIVARNLFSGGFNVRIILVNPRATEVLGQPCFLPLPHFPKLGILPLLLRPRVSFLV